MSRQDWLNGPRLKLRHLHLLAALGRVGTLGAAAESLRITQPAASRLLAEIEALVGEPIFERLPRGLRPNAYGEIVIRRARVVVAELGAAGDEVEALRQGLGGTVAIGVVTAPAVDTVAGVLTDLQQTRPDLQITVEVETSLPLVRALLDGKLDFVLARIPEEVDASLLDYREIGPEALVFLVRDDHPRLAAASLRFADLVEQSWVMQPPGTLLRRRVEIAFRRAGLRPPMRVLNTSSALLTLAVIARGGVIGAVTASVAALFSASGPFRVLAPIDQVEGIQVEAFGLIRRRDRPLSPAAEAVYAVLGAALFQGAPEP